MVDMKLYLVFVCLVACAAHLEVAEPDFQNNLDRARKCKPSRTCTKQGGTCYGKFDTIPVGMSSLGFCDKKKKCQCFASALQQQPSCQPSKKCARSGGKCYKQGGDIPYGAEYLGWCKKRGKCQCWKEATINTKGSITTASPPTTCRQQRRCKSVGGLCYKYPPANMEYLGFFCNRRSRCKCFRKQAPPSPTIRSSSICTTSGAKPGNRCQFPFKFRGHLYNDCTKKGADDGKLWCSTKTDKYGNHVTGNWGHCGRCEQAAEKLPNFYHLCDMKNPNTKGVAGLSFQKWSNNQVPYQFDSSFTNVDRQTFYKATQQISSVTCISFVESSASQYLRVRRDCSCGGSCFGGAYVEGLGAGSPRVMAVGSPCLDPNNQNSVGLLIHEILHALGIGHTQTRPDRNSYITVNFQNIQPSSASSQFQLCSGCSTYGTPYDCQSIMHYRSWAFAPQWQQGKYSMTAKSSSCDLLKTNRVLTATDIDLINKIYGCSSPTPTPTPTPSPSPPSSKSSCSGNCGGKALNCWCDAACTKYNDCCSDKATYCSTPSPSPAPTPAPTPTPTPPSPPSCSLTCNKNCGFKVSCNGNSCYCDSFCHLFNDCCNDKTSFC